MGRGWVLFLMALSSLSAFWSGMPGASFSEPFQANCDDVIHRGDSGHLNLMTLNLLFSEFTDREERLETIADFIAKNDEPIDVILLQEAVGGLLSGTENSSLDLKHLLAERGLFYNHSFRIENGLKHIFSEGNAILSRCEILSTFHQSLPYVREVFLDGFEIPLKRIVMESRIHIPDWGDMNVYHTHLCAYCSPKERLDQTEILMGFIENIENELQEGSPMILGGDFNIDLNLPEDFPSYQLITQSGWIDTYTYDHRCISCCTSPTDSGCTFAVEGNPYAINPITGQPEKAARVDYVFMKGEKISPGGSTVVFNSAPWVSDHSGVLTRINLK
jgi:maltose 6'-phosphate phosphatase